MSGAAQRFYKRFRPTLTRLAQEGGEQMAKKEMRKEASSAYASFWRGFGKVSAWRNKPLANSSSPPP